MKTGHPKRTTAAATLIALVCLVCCAGAAGAATPSFRAELPMAITSSGQSLDAYTLSVVCKRVKLDHTFNNMLKPEGLKGIKTLLIVMGGSAKGLGEAGIDEKVELDRVNHLLVRAREAKIKVIAVHLGGESRKGALSDKFIDPVIAKADYLIVTEDSNKDGAFAKMAREKKLGISVVKQAMDVAKELKSIFPPR
ncbi:MAG: DUF6305 family protein [Syntrophales bacterium]